MTLDVIAEDDQLLIAKWEKVESMRDDPATEPGSVSFPFTVEETEAMERLWRRGLIRPTGVASAELTDEGIAEARRLLAARR
jgi:hypothetical protein